MAAVSVRDSRPGGMQVRQGSSHPPFRAAPPGVQKHPDVRILFSARPSVARSTCQTYCRQNVWRHTAGRMFVGVLRFVVPPDGARWRTVLVAGMQVHRGSPHPPLRPRQTQNVRRHIVVRMFVGVLMFVVSPDGARWRTVRATGMQVHRGSPHPPLRPHQTPLYTTHPDHRNPVSWVSRPCGRWVSRPCGRLESRRCAVWTLAAWRGLICAR